MPRCYSTPNSIHPRGRPQHCPGRPHGAGKTAIGKSLAARLGLPFHDADQEIEQAAGITITEIFARHGEAHFRAGEKRVIQRLLEQGPIVLDARWRRLHGCRGRGRSSANAPPQSGCAARCRFSSTGCAAEPNRPLLNNGDPAEILQRLAAERSPLYAQADIIIDGSEDPPELTTQSVLKALAEYQAPRKVSVNLSSSSYQVLIGAGILHRAGAFIAPVLPQQRCVIITDATVAGIHLPALAHSLSEAGIAP